MNTNSFWQQGTRMGIFFAILFVACFVWFYLRGGDADMKQLHDNLFALAFFGWSGMNIISFILGAIQSFIWGYLALIIWRLTAKLLPRQ